MPVDQISVRGGKPLQGEVEIRGAKNSLPKALVAALLSSEPSRIRNVATIEDVEIVSRMVDLFGGRVEKPTPDELVVVSERLALPKEEELAAVSGKSRIPILFAGPLVARLGEVFIPTLGGCRIGKRPINFHLEVLRRLGAEIEEKENGFYFKANGLRGAKIELAYPSVGATEQVLLAASLAEGVTELSGAAIEPEIIDLVAVLQKMGAIIAVSTDRKITIVGVKRLGGFDHKIIPDRIEAASWAAAAAVTGGRIFVRNARQLDLLTFLNKFRQVGGEFTVTDEGISFWRGKELRSVALETDVHPGFMTDWQSPFVVLLTQARGASVIHETVYEDRFGYVETLNRMGAQIQVYRECLGGDKRCRFGERNYLHSAVVIGPTPLRAAAIAIPDLRAGFSYVIAALAADGVSEISNLKTVYRGYERFLEKLKSLGAEIL